MLLHTYVSGPKNKSAQVRKNMNTDNYSVKKITDGTVVGISNHDDVSAAHDAAKKHLSEGYGNDLSRGLSTSSLIKKNTGHKVHFNTKSQMIHTDSNKVITQNADNHSVSELIQHAKNFKEEVEQVDEILIQNYISGPKNKRAEVHKDNNGDYEVKHFLGGKHVDSKKFSDSGQAHGHASMSIKEDAPVNSAGGGGGGVDGIGIGPKGEPGGRKAKLVKNILRRRKVAEELIFEVLDTPDKIKEYQKNANRKYITAKHVGDDKTAKKRLNGYKMSARKSLRMSEAKLLDVPTPSKETIAKRNNMSVKSVEQQLKAGVKIEKEHTTKSKIAKEIALDHLGEKPNYYKLLKKVEK